jgi:glycerol-3-phosphate dehydrogenase (NAD(P)+)
MPFRGPSFGGRLDDVVGVEIGAALKNISPSRGRTGSVDLSTTRWRTDHTRSGGTAIGVRDGRRRIAGGLNGRRICVTCTGALSRNRHVGIELGRGRSLEEILAGMRMVAEGVRSTSAALALGERYGVELPIAGQVAEVLAGRLTPTEAVGNLMLRRQRGEHDGGKAD